MRLNSLKTIQIRYSLIGLLTLFVLLVFIVLFYLRYIIFFNGFVMLSNFTRPYNVSQLNYFPIFYDKYQYFGSIISSPFSQIDYLAIEQSLFIFPSRLFGLVVGEKIFAICTTFIYAGSFFIFSRIFSSNFRARMISTLFFLFNPFTIQLYIYGDFQQFVFISFSLISLFFLYKGINPTTLKLSPYFLLSCILVPFSFSFLPMTLISFPLGVFITFYLVFFNKDKGQLRLRVRRFFIYSSMWIISVIVISLPFILPYLYSPTSYLPNSVSSLPLEIFQSSGLSFFKVITLEAYPPDISWIIVKQFYGLFLYNTWDLFIVTFIVLITSSAIFVRDKRLALFSMILVLFSIIGAQTKGPLGTLTVYFYEHLIGYQAINYPYLWVWLVNVPVISAMVAIFIDDVLNGVPEIFKFTLSHFKKTTAIYAHSSSLIFSSPKIKRVIRRGTFIAMAIILGIIVIMPISTQGYYTHKNVNGLGETSVPQWFNSLDYELVNLTSRNNSAVIFNTINSYFFFGNDSNNATNNLLQIFPQFRTVSLSSYIPNYNALTNFFYWFYYTLYNNETKYSAQILSAVGVQYFVDIYNANSGGYPAFVPWSYNINASSILIHQPGWETVLQTNNFSIFKDIYYNGNEYYTNNFSLILGNYNTLNNIAYLGINLANVTPVFPTDLMNSQNLSGILNHTNLVVMSGYNSIYDLILSIAQSPLIYPVNYVNGEQTDPSLTWTNSERSNNYPFYASLLPYAETSGNNSLNIPLNVEDSGIHSIFAKIALDNSSVKGGILNILVNGKSTISLNTSGSYQNETNGFLWIKFNASLMKGKNTLTLQSKSGFNAVSEISVLNETEMNRATITTENFLSKERSNIIEIFQPQMIVPSNNTGYYYGSGLGYKFPESNYVYLNGLARPNNFSVRSPIPFNGTILINSLSIDSYTFNVAYRNKSTIIGVSPSVHLPTNTTSSGSILLPISELRSANISITSGYAFIGPIALLPSNYRFIEAPIEPTSVGNITYRGIDSAITKFNISETKYDNYTTISGSFDYRNVSDYFPVSIVFSGNYLYNRSLVFLSNVSGPATLDINGMTIESTDFYGIPLISPSLNDQYQGRPRNFELNFVPEYFHSNVSYKVSFVVKVIGYTNYPEQIVRYSPVITPGPNISYTISGYEINALSSGILILKVPFSSGFESNVKLSSADNGLMTLIFYEGQVTGSPNNVIHVSADVYRFLLIGTYTAVALPSTYLGLYLLLQIRRRKKTN